MPRNTNDRSGADLPRRILRACVGSVAVLAAVTTFAVITVQEESHADPATGVTSAEPREVFKETFEVGGSRTATSLADYVGVAGQTHTADAFWLNTRECNGVVLQYAEASFPSRYCQRGSSRDAQNNTRRMADVLGQVEAGVSGSETKAAPVNGSTAKSQGNHAVTAFTMSKDGADDQTMIRTSPFTIKAKGSGFYATSVDVAETSCEARGGRNNSRLNFALVAGGTTHKITESAIRACTSDEVSYYGSPKLRGGGPYVAAGRFYSNGSVLLTPAELESVQVEMQNETGKSYGNDFAYDNIRLTDVTPRLDKAFAPDRPTAGEISTLTFTVTNTTELGAKRGWGFTDNLPKGLTVAKSTTVGGTCGAETTAKAGGSTIAVRDGALEPETESCTITVGVTSDAPREPGSADKCYRNCAANLSDVTGLKLPKFCATVTFTPPSSESPSSSEPSSESDSSDADPADSSSASTDDSTDSGDDEDGLPQTGVNVPLGLALGVGVLLSLGTGLVLIGRRSKD